MTFFVERLERPAAKKLTYTSAKQKKSLEKRGKLVMYDKVDQHMKTMLDASRLHE